MSRLIIIWIILRFLWFLIWGSFRTVVVAVITLWKTVPSEIDDIATHWVARTINTQGFPNTGEDYLYWFYYFVAWVIFLIGWIISAYITILLVHLIFR
jgi:hypothetical protein